MFYYEIFSTLNKAKVRYLVVGGVAMVLHGAVRLTADIDLVVALEPKNARRFIKIMKKRGYLSRVPVAMEDFAELKEREKWIRRKGLLVYSLYHPKRHGELIDVFVKEPFDFEKAYKRRARVRVDHALSVPVASIPDLIALKRKAGRPQDLADIAALRKLA